MFGIGRATLAPVVFASIDAERAIFTRYMMEVRGLSKSPRHIRRRHISEFLAGCFKGQPIEKSKIALADVVHFVMRRTCGLSPGSVKSVGGSLLRYLHFKAILGTPVTALIAPLPRAALCHLSGVPDALSPEEVGDGLMRSIAVTLPACVTTQSRDVFWTWICVVRKSRICASTLSIGLATRERRYSANVRRLRWQRT